MCVEPNQAGVDQRNFHRLIPRDAVRGERAVRRPVAEPRVLLLDDVESLARYVLPDRLDGFYRLTGCIHPKHQAYRRIDRAAHRLDLEGVLMIRMSRACRWQHVEEQPPGLRAMHSAMVFR